VTPTAAWQMMIEHFGFCLEDLRCRLMALRDD